jgi:hypothetical protein
MNISSPCSGNRTVMCRVGLAYYLDEAARLSCSNADPSIFRSAAPTFSSKCCTLDVPGIGNITGERHKSHANAT